MESRGGAVKPKPVHPTVQARRFAAALAVLTVAWLAAGAVPAHADDRDLLRRGTSDPYVFILFDTSGSMHWSPKCTAEQVAAGVCDFACPSGDCFTAQNGDDSASKLYQAKEALYEVIQAADNVDFGFATYNQDQLRVGAKHWLYRARQDGVGLAATPFPAAGSVEVFGDQWPCDTGAGDNNLGCYRNAPASLADPWEADRVRRLPKGGDDLSQNRTVYVRTGGITYEVTYDPVAGSALGALTIDVRIEVRSCGNNSCNQFVGAQNVTFERVGQFISWDIGVGRNNPQLGYFSQAAASPGFASNTCAGWDGNEDSGVDDFNNVNLRFPTFPSGASPLEDLGDVIPLSWNDDNRNRILGRLAPNRLLGEVVPDFSVARYFENQPGNRGVLELANGAARPLVAFGATPLGNSIADFRTWYAGCAQGACPGQTGWKDLAQAQDPDWGCRKTYLLVITDGDDTCPGADACSGTAALFSQEAVKTYVVGFGVERTPGNRLQCMAENGGSGEPIYPENKDELVDALTSIFSEIQEEARSFASAAVPTVQASVDDKIYLSQFTPLNRSSVWDGHLDAFLEPLPLVTSGPDAGRPDRTIRCGPGRTSGCLAWDAGEQLQLQTTGLDLAASPPRYGMGPDALERRVFYARADAAGLVPAPRRLFEPPPDPADPADPATFGTAWLDLLDGFEVPATDPNAIDTAKETMQYILRPKQVQVTNPQPPPANLDIPVLLGDIFHSNPVAVGSPQNLVYFLKDVGAKTVQENGEPVEVGGYQQFALRHRVRRKMVMVGANDGQLHAFDAGLYSATLDDLTRSDPDYFTCVDDTGARVDPVPVIAEERFGNGTGHEVFSFVPRASMDELPKLPDSTSHRYTVDSAIAVGDVNIGPVETVVRPDEPDFVSAWRTVVVGGLRRGGRGYYALDVTQPDAITETPICSLDGIEQTTSVGITAGDVYVPRCLGDLATGTMTTAGCGPRAFPTVLWELEDTWDENLDGRPDLGDTWSIPVLGRIRVCDGIGAVCDPSDPNNQIEDRWVAVFGGGFDEQAQFSGPGAGSFLYMVDVASGETIYKAELEGMAPSDPAVVDTDQDGYLDRVYVGTTAGHLYKVNLRSIPRLRDVQVSPGPGLPMATVRRISTADADDPAWRPFEVFDTQGRPIFYPASAIFVSELGRFAIAFGTGDRDDLWSNDPQTGRFYVFLDQELPRGDTNLPVIASDLQAFGADSGNVAMDTNLLRAAPGAATAGWYIELEPQERLITKPFALSGVLFFTSYMPDSGSGTGNGGAQGGGRTPADDELCARTGQSRLFVVFATNANALVDVDGIRTRYREVPAFVTDPFTTLSSTKNAPVDGGGEGPPGHADELCRNLDELGRQLRSLFPDTCRFAGYSLDIQTIRSDRGLVCIAPVPVCFQEQNWTEF
jgi:hypothetical protein